MSVFTITFQSQDSWSPFAEEIKSSLAETFLLNLEFSDVPKLNMFKHRLRGISKSFGSQIDPAKSEQLRRTKSDIIDNNLTRMVKLMKKEEQRKKNGKSRKEKELVGLVEDFYNQYQSLYVKASPCIMERLSSVSSSSSESEYFSSEELDSIANADINDSNQKPVIRERERSTTRANNINKYTLNKVDFKTQSSNEFEGQLRTQAKELERWNKQKRNLELQVESQACEIKQLYAKNAELHAKVLDLEKLLKERCKEEASLEVKALTTQVVNPKNMLELQNERSQKEYSESLAKMENLNTELETQVAEQLNDENRESHKMTNKRYEEENKRFGEKIVSYEVKEKSLPIEFNLNGLELGAQALDLAAGKIEEQRERVLGLVSKMLVEVKFVNDWIRERNGEIKGLKDKVGGLTTLLDEKEEQNMLLREKVWKLDAKVSKEGGEKLNLVKAVNQLERKVWKLEKNLREKDEELVSLAEKKREAIRQLCSLIEFHRDRCVYLNDLISKRRINHRK